MPRDLAVIAPPPQQSNQLGIDHATLIPTPAQADSAQDNLLRDVSSGPRDRLIDRSYALDQPQKGPASVNCPACGAENPPQARFCGQCGAPLLAETPPPPPQPPPITTPPLVEKQFGKPTTGGPWVGIALVVLLVFLLLGGMRFVGFHVGPSLFGGGFFAVFALLALLGACVWVGVVGKWPGTRRRVHPIIRVLISLIPIGLNGLLAFGVGYLVAADCSDFCGNEGPGRGIAVGAAVFFGAVAVDVVAFALLFGTIVAGLWVWRRGQSSHATPGQ